MEEKVVINIQPAKNEGDVNTILVISREIMFVVEKISKEVVTLSDNSKGKAIVRNYNSVNE